MFYILLITHLNDYIEIKSNNVDISNVLNVRNIYTVYHIVSRPIEIKCDLYKFLN